jgi:hypothetical protein
MRRSNKYKGTREQRKGISLVKGRENWKPEDWESSLGLYTK